MDVLKRKAIAAVAVTVAGMGTGVSPVAAEEGPPKHGHVLLLGVNEANFTYRKCIDLKPVELRAHHSSLHTGRAGQALVGAGHFVLPTSDIEPGSNLPENCAGVDEWLADLAG